LQLATQGIGNGIPLGAVVTTPEIAQVLTRRCYFNTFGGNPLCTAGGLAVLKVLEKERLQENAFIVGSYLKDRLRGLQEKHDSMCMHLIFTTWLLEDLTFERFQQTSFFLLWQS
jgi:4-aminobutyrate aminotransferase-like enzyme